MDGRLIQAIGHDFRDPSLIETALTHPGAAAHSSGPNRFERLEFLGDRVLGLIVADMLLRRFPSESEGALARRLADLAKQETLVTVACQIGIDKTLRLAKGESRDRSGPLADACEAVLGAIYLDGGIEPAARLIRACWGPLMEQSPAPPRDAKTALQEWAQGRGRPLPVYTIADRAGPDHEPAFVVRVSVDGFEPADGRGGSKRAAEQAAAAALLERLPK
jgi:ribonuclease-3